MQIHRYFEGLSPQYIFDIMSSMLDAEQYMYVVNIREDDYEWIIGRDVWDRISKSVSFNCSDSLNYKIFDIKVAISKNELNTITLKKKDEGRNEMPVERKSTSSIYYTAVTAKSVSAPAIKKVIFNDPATIVFWSDGSKTVVKCQDGDIYDPEKGLAMAISKKALGNKGNYCNEFKKWLPEDEEDVAEFRFDPSDFNVKVNSLLDSINSHFPLKKEDLMKKDE